MVAQGHAGRPHRQLLYDALADAWAVAEDLAPGTASLEARTLAFVRAFAGSTLAEEVKEAALFNLSTLRTQTCFRTPDGRFFGFEGSSNRGGCCFGSCTHVWNYEQATAFLFGELARSMRETEFLEATNVQGLMSFGVRLPIGGAREFGKAAADGQMGTIPNLLPPRDETTVLACITTSPGFAGSKRRASVGRATGRPTRGPGRLPRSYAVENFLHSYQAIVANSGIIF